jgi:hypothetical protein
VPATISTADEETCKWLMFTRPAQNIVEQNLVVHQVDKPLFFYAKEKSMKGGLLFWFSKEYVVLCGKWIKH